MVPVTPEEAVKDPVAPQVLEIGAGDALDKFFGGEHCDGTYS